MNEPTQLELPLESVEEEKASLGKKVVLDAALYESMLRDRLILGALSANGMDNWSGYEVLADIMPEIEAEVKYQVENAPRFEDYGDAF